jgi:hypothetical protein
MIGVFVGFSRIFLLGILIFKRLTARSLYKSFGVDGLNTCYSWPSLFYLAMGLNFIVWSLKIMFSKCPIFWVTKSRTKIQAGHLVCKVLRLTISTSSLTFTMDKDLETRYLITTPNTTLRRWFRAAFYVNELMTRRTAVLDTLNPPLS